MLLFSRQCRTFSNGMGSMDQKSHFAERLSFFSLKFTYCEREHLLFLYCEIIGVRGNFFFENWLLVTTLSISELEANIPRGSGLWLSLGRHYGWLMICHIPKFWSPIFFPLSFRGKCHILSDFDCLRSRCSCMIIQTRNFCLQKDKKKKFPRTPIIPQIQKDIVTGKLFAEKQGCHVSFFTSK